MGLGQWKLGVSRAAGKLKSGRLGRRDRYRSTRAKEVSILNLGHVNEIRDMTRGFGELGSENCNQRSEHQRRLLQRSSNWGSLHRRAQITRTMAIESAEDLEQGKGTNGKNAGS